MSGAGPVGGGRRQGRPVKIFVSYRRKDVAGDVDRLVGDLNARYGQSSVFLDADSIRAGRPFAEVIAEWIAESDVVLVVIGDRWLEQSVKGGLRIEEAPDHVRREIEMALKGRAPVIPVLVEDAPMPEPRGLPRSIAKLSGLQAVQIRRGRHWSPDVEYLKREIDEIIGYRPVGPSRRRGKIVAAAALAIAAGAVAAILAVSSKPSPNHASTVIQTNVAQRTSANAASGSTPSPGTATTATTPSTSTTRASKEVHTSSTASAPARNGSGTATTASKSTTPSTGPLLGPTQVVATQWREIERHHFYKAYSYFDTAYQESEPQSKWVTAHQEEGINDAKFVGRATGYSPGSSATTVEVVSLRTEDAEHGCREWEGHYAMKLEGDWDIDQAVIEHHACHG